MFGAAKLIAGMMALVAVAVVFVSGDPADGEWRAAGHVSARAAVSEAPYKPDGAHDALTAGAGQSGALSALRLVRPAFAQARSAPKFLRIVVSGDGGIAFSGTGRPGTSVVLEKDGRSLSQVRVGANGRWSVGIEEGLGAGDHVVSAYGASSGDASGSRLVAGQEVRISIPESFEGGSIVAYERDEPLEEDVAKDEPIETTAADRDAAEDLARAANREFDRLSRSEPGLDAREAGDREGPAPSEVASGDGVVDFIEEAGRIYQRSVVDRLRSGSSDATPPSDAERQEQELLEREAEATRQAEQERERLERERLAAEARERAERERQAAEQRRRAEAERQRAAEAAREDETALSERAEEERRAAERRAEIERREAEAEALAEEARQRAREAVERRERELAAQREAERLAREQAEAERREREEQEALLRQQLAERRALEEQRRREQAAVEAQERRRAAELARDEREAEARREELLRQKRLRAERVFDLDDIGRRRLEDLRRAEVEALAETEAEIEAEEAAERERIAQRERRQLPPAPVRGSERQSERRAANGFDDPLGRDDFNAADGRDRDGDVLRSRPIDVEMAEGRRAEARGRDGMEPGARDRQAVRLRRGSIKDTGWPEDAAYPVEGGSLSVASYDDGTRVADWRLDPNSKCRSSAGRLAYRPRPVYTVAYGDTLWTISARFYGAGYRYRQIVRANRGKIRRGRLIYPCQKLRLPGRLSARR